MTVTRQVLFLQGAGAGTHDDWDAALVADLRRRLGEGCDVRYPRLPDEAEPSYARWSAAIRTELDGLDDGAAVVGHSVGGTVLVHALAEQPPKPRLAAIVLISAPFVGGEGWPADGFPEPRDLGQALPDGVRVHVVHGSDDVTVPPEHARLYGRAVPQAQVLLLQGRDHQLGEDLSEVAGLLQAAWTPVIAEQRAGPG